MTVGRLPSIDGGIQPTLLTTTGDIMYASAASTPARLGIGSTSQVLTVASGIPSWATPAGGKVLQVVSGTYSTATTTTSTSFTDTGLSLSITPSSNTSKVLVLITQPYAHTRSSDQSGGAINLLRNSTTVLDLTGTDNYPLYFRSIGGNTSTEFYNILSISYLDSPATTSSITYKTQMRVYQASSSQNIQAQPLANTSAITLLEIGA